MQNGQIGISPLANVELLVRLKEQEPLEARDNYVL